LEPFSLAGAHYGKPHQLEGTRNIEPPAQMFGPLMALSDDTGPHYSMADFQR